MEKEIRHFINHHCPFKRQKKSHVQGKAPLPITSSAPLKIVEIDFLHLEKSSGDFKYILSVTYHFIRYAHASPFTTKLLLLLLYNSTTTLSFALVFRLSYCMIKEESFRMCFHILCKLVGYPQSANHSLPPKNKWPHWTHESDSTSNVEKYKTLWKDHVNKVIHAYDCTKHNSPGFYLIFVYLFYLFNFFHILSHLWSQT